MNNTKIAITIFSVAFMLSRPAYAEEDQTRDLVPSQKVFVEAIKTQLQTIKISAQVDRRNATYKVGDQVRIRVTTDKDAYVYILNKGTKRTTWLFPNAYHKEPFLKAGQTLVPAEDGKWNIDVRGPAGTELLYFHASTKSLSKAERRKLAAEWKTGKVFADLKRSDDELLKDLAAVRAKGMGSAYLVVKVTDDKK